MIKKLIAPVQTWLLSQDKCVGCATPLSKGKTSEHAKGQKVTCKCGRIFIKDKKSNRYRRALFSEV